MFNCPRCGSGSGLGRMIQLNDVLAMSPNDRDRLIGEKLYERPGFPSTDAGDDLAVHMHVCKTWDTQGLLGNYFHALEELLCKEGGEEVDEEPSLYSMMHYRTGMFSTVAIYVVLHYEEWDRCRDCGWHGYHEKLTKQVKNENETH